MILATKVATKNATEASGERISECNVQRSWSNFGRWQLPNYFTKKFELILTIQNVNEKSLKFNRFLRNNHDSSLISKLQNSTSANKVPGMTARMLANAAKANGGGGSSSSSDSGNSASAAAAVPTTSGRTRYYKNYRF